MTRWMCALSLILTTGLVGLGRAPVAAQSLPAKAIETTIGAAVDASDTPAQFIPEAKSTTAPAYCKPCLYYSGDLNPANSDGQLNGNNRSSVAYIYTPFSVPTGRTWQVSGLIVNLANGSTTGGIVDPQTAGWSISQGVSAGLPGTLLASGVSSASITPTGRPGPGGLTEYTLIVKVKPAIKLTAGTYFVNVLPQCTNPSNTKCSANTYETNVTDASPPHQFGPANLAHASFFFSFLFASNYASAAFDQYSFGVIGTSSGH